MSYGIDEWEERIAQRSDFTTSLVHLTRGRGDQKPVDVLFQILEERRLKGSTTASGFIVGDRPAVCLQEAPLYSLAQSVYTEQKYRALNSGTKVRYQGFGLQFDKTFVFSHGGRPVFYEKTSLAKQFLPPKEWWRIVGFDLSNDSSVVDWTHEREWRVPEELPFKLGDTVVLLPSPVAYRNFVKKCLKNDRPEFLSETAGIVQFGSVFY